MFVVGVVEVLFVVLWEVCDGLCGVGVGELLWVPVFAVVLCELVEVWVEGGFSSDDAEHSLVAVH